MLGVTQVRVYKFTAKSKFSSNPKSHFNSGNTNPYLPVWELENPVDHTWFYVLVTKSGVD